MTTTGPLSPAELRMGDDLLAAVHAKVRGDGMAAALKAIPHLKENPILTGAFLVGMVATAVRDLAAHCRETPTQTVNRLWSKPEGAR